jgi:hypothetical protein
VIRILHSPNTGSIQAVLVEYQWNECGGYWLGAYSAWEPAQSPYGNRFDQQYDAITQHKGKGKLEKGCIFKIHGVSLPWSLSLGFSEFLWKDF